MPDHELVIRITAPTAENGEHWATTIRDLVAAEYGDSMRLAFDGPRLVGPAGADLHEAVRGALEAADGHSCQTLDGADYDALTDAALAVIEPRIADLLAGAEVTDAAEEPPPVVQSGLCGLPHYDHPQSTCSEPAGHADGPRATCHGAALVIGGEERGGVAWGPEVAE
jgi:hypothetical protein